jgi:CheY-like chemotaxis protein
MNPTTSGPTLLIVDDDAALCFLFSYLLNERGYSAISAGSGKEAIRVYRDRRTEVVMVLLDMQMPDLDGLQVLAQLREINSDVRVIIISGYADQLTSELRNERGVVAFLAKPFSLESLLEVLAVEGFAPPLTVKRGR